MPERGVVDGRDVPDDVRRNPDRQCDNRVREQARAGKPAEASGQARRDAEHQEGRGPLREDDVLEQVRAEERRCRK